MISHYQVYFTTEIVKYVVNNIIRDREDIQLRNITRNCWKKTPRAFCFMGLITKKDWFVFGPSVRSRSLQPSWDILISINSHKVRNLILFLQNTITISRNGNRKLFPGADKAHTTGLVSMINIINGKKVPTFRINPWKRENVCF